MRSLKRTRQISSSRARCMPAVSSQAAEYSHSGWKDHQAMRRAKLLGTQKKLTRVLKPSLRRRRTYRYSEVTAARLQAR